MKTINVTERTWKRIKKVQLDIISRKDYYPTQDDVINMLADAWDSMR